MFPIEGPIIVEAMREASSALPDAPVIEEAPRSLRRSRQALARSLRAVADWLDPPRCASPRPHPR
jgi:hypothetical protein